MNRTKIALATGAGVAALSLGLVGANLASAETTPTPTPSASGGTAPNGTTPDGQRGPGGHTHTAVTGDELAKVTAAMKAKDSAVTVTKVEKDPDGSYDITGTKAGAAVRFDASADLKTISEGKARGGGRDGGGKGGHSHTAVTGDELAKVTAAVKAKDSAVTVERVMKDEDGSYDVFGTKAGTPIGFEVSKDLKTITERQGGMGRGGKGGHSHTAVTGDELATVTAAVKAKDSAVTVERVMKDEDGSYDVFGTKAGSRIGFEVSKDLKTITERQGRPGGGMRGGQPGGQTTPGGTTSPTPSASGTA